MLTLVIKACFSEQLLERQSTLSRYHYGDWAPVKAGTIITIGNTEGTKPTTFIDDVEKIGSGTTIGTNTKIGARSIILGRATIGDNVTIEKAVLLHNGVKIGAGSHILEGACLLTGVDVGDEVIVGEGTEVNYDVFIPTGDIVENTVSQQ